VNVRYENNNQHVPIYSSLSLSNFNHRYKRQWSTMIMLKNDNVQGLQVQKWRWRGAEKSAAAQGLEGSVGI